MAENEDLHETQSELTVVWKIKDFFSLPEKNGEFYHSNKFYSCGASWYLSVCPNGRSKDSQGWISLYLMRSSFGNPISLEYTLRVDSADEKSESNFTNTFDEIIKGAGHAKLISRSILEEKRVKLSTPVALTVFCTLKNNQPISIAGSLYRRLQDVSDNLRNIYTKEKQTDLILKLEDVNIPAHRMILETRSPVFAAMFSHDTKEKITGEIAIEDLDKNSMGILLNYMYSGDIDNLNTENVLSVYAAADKYDIKDIKEMCMNFITLHLSKEWICDVIKFAELYQEDELSLHTKKYFKENAKEILETDKWKTFAKENHDLGVELLSTLVKSLLPK